METIEKKKTDKNIVVEHAARQEEYATCINSVITLTNKTITELQNLEKFVSPSFYKTNVMVLINRIEKNVQVISEKSPETEIIIEKTLKTIKNPVARKKIQEILKEFE